MTETLEARIETPKSLKTELAESMRKYPSNWVSYMKQLAPTIFVSSLGSATAQWLAERMGFEGTTAQTVAGYIGGYGVGYPFYFGSEYILHKDRYPRGILSKEFGKFVGTFLAADYIADLSTFTPTFIASNAYLADHTDIAPFPRGLIAWNTAGVLYTTVMAGLHPAIQRVNQAINRRIKSVYHKLKKKK
ncbi:MAG: hypothetical protein ACP5NS_01065 [Candidatus Pacearchaeota archaeon]